MLASLGVLGLLAANLARGPSANPQAPENEPLTVYCAASNKSVFEAIRRDYEEVIANGGAPLDRDSTAVVVLEGTAGDHTIRAEPWTFGITFGLGRLVDAPAGSDSPNVAGQDCCLDVPSTTCTPGQDGQRGSCSECAGCWPEVCNFGQSPLCGGAALAGCGS